MAKDRDLIYIFKISSAYKRCTVWCGSLTGQKVGTTTIEPNKELSRRQRYDVIAEWLLERCGLRAPLYVPTVREDNQ